MILNQWYGVRFVLVFIDNNTHAGSQLAVEGSRSWYFSTGLSPFKTVYLWLCKLRVAVLIIFNWLYRDIKVATKTS